MDTETEEQLLCAYNDGKKGTRGIQVESQGGIIVCVQHEKLLHAKNKKVRCKLCGVPILPNWRRDAVTGLEHSLNCPDYREVA